MSLAVFSAPQKKPLAQAMLGGGDATEHSSCKWGGCCGSVAGKPVEEIVGGPFLCSGVNSVFLTSFVELQVIQLSLLERKEACSAGRVEGAFISTRVFCQFAVSRLTQRELLVCTGQELLC